MLHRTAAAMVLALAGCAAITGVDALREGSVEVADGGPTDTGTMDSAAPLNEAAPAESSASDAEGSPDVLDAGTGDAASPLDATLDADGAVNLALNGGFEQGCVSPWNSFQGSLSDSGVSHSGSNACLVCVDPGQTVYTIDQNNGFVSNPLMGDTYLAEAWVRAAPDAGATSQLVSIVERIWTNGMQTDEQEGTLLSLTSSWQKVTITYTVPVSGGSFLNVYVPASKATTGDCFLVDDIALYKQ